MSGLISLDERPVIDLRHYAFRHNHAGIEIFGTWYMDPDTRQSAPALVNAALLRGKGRRPVPCVIPLNDMWRWGLMGHGDPAHVSACVNDWIESGALPGSTTNKADVFRVLDAVMSRLRDLVSMPPLPPKAAIKHGAVPVGIVEITERETGRTIQEIEVTASHVRH